MSRLLMGILILGGVTGLIFLWAVPRFHAGSDVPLVTLAEHTRDHEDPAAGLCPWRNPDADTKQFFAAATDHQEEALVLSRYRQEVSKKLGRLPTGDENLLRIYRIRQGSQTIGTVIPRRIRGESGVIEIVIATDTHGTVIGANLQRLRETEEVANTLRSASFLGAFRGKTAFSDWQLGKDFTPVSEAARPSAAALLDGTRTALTLLDVGDKAVRQAQATRQ